MSAGGSAICKHGGPVGRCEWCVELFKLQAALSVSQKALKEAQDGYEPLWREELKLRCDAESALDAALRREKEAVEIFSEFRRCVETKKAPGDHTEDDEYCDEGMCMWIGERASVFLSTLPPSAAKRKHDKYCNKMGNGMCGDPKCPNKEADLPPSAPCPMLMAHNADGTPTPGCTCPKSEAA